MYNFIILVATHMLRRTLKKNKIHVKKSYSVVLLIMLCLVCYKFVQSQLDC